MDSRRLLASRRQPVGQRPPPHRPGPGRRVEAPLRPSHSGLPTGPRANKYLPPVDRIDGARGDKNLICACPDIDGYR